MNIYGRFDRRAMNRMHPERAHAIALRSLVTAARAPAGLRALRRLAPEQDERLRMRLWDLPFSNPLGVAAGLDKNAVAITPLLALGFSHVETGTVTLRPQPGNDQPRLWRIPECDAVINALGFPSDGAAAVRSRLLAARRRGSSASTLARIGRSRRMKRRRPMRDLFSRLGDVGSYITVNVSSPNTPGLRSLQMSDELEAILKAVTEANERLATARKQIQRPVLVKIAPDLTREEVEAVGGSAVAGGADGIIATNTTTSREGIPEQYRDLPGGLSGPPLREQATAVVRALYESVGDQLPIIGVGGIASADDVIARMRAGASLVQLYTSFIYGGPSLPGTILRGLSESFADEAGLRSIAEIVGENS